MKRSLAREIVETVALTLIIFVVIHFAVQSYRISGPSMQPGLQNNEYVLVNKIAYIFHPPERGDIIVFHYPLDTTRDFIKRVIGLPGDTITVNSNTVWVDGVKLNEPYVSAESNSEGQTWKVPQGDYFVMGDNRPISDDSRTWGFVPQSDLVGKVVLLYWPISGFKLINTYPTVFANVK
ncbi:MAG TPA: signal peptidase I [Ktedonobacteraceae bacterium]|nr:signal peptidase I [Ktedonobacteraceae bacterium]